MAESQINDEDGWNLFRLFIPKGQTIPKVSDLKQSSDHLLTIVQFGMGLMELAHLFFIGCQLGQFAPLGSGWSSQFICLGLRLHCGLSSSVVLHMASPCGLPSKTVISDIVFSS